MRNSRVAITNTAAGWANKRDRKCLVRRHARAAARLLRNGGPMDGRRRLKVAVVAPSLRILGGQAVQADRLLRAWDNDPDVDAWLVPVNPLPPRFLRFALGIKYL